MASSITERRPRSSMSRMVNACTPDSRTCGLLHQIDVAQAHNHGIARAPPWDGSRQVRPAPADPCRAAGQRHAVDVAAGAGIRRVHVGVRVEPDQADLLFAAFAEVARDAGHGSDGDGMVAAQHQRDASALAGHPATCRRGARKLRRSAADTWRARSPSGQALGLLDRNVAEIFDVIAERVQPRVQIGHAHGRRTHIHAAAALAQVERRADDRDVGCACPASERDAGTPDLSCPLQSTAPRAS